MKLISTLLIATFFCSVYLSTIKKGSILYSKSLFKWNILKKEPSFLSSRQGYSLNLYNNKVILFGGDKNETLYYNDLYQFDLITLTWNNITTYGEIPSNRSDHSSVIIGNKLWIYGGKNVNGYLNDLYTLDLDNLIWKKHLFIYNLKNDNIYYGRSGHGAVVTDFNKTNSILIFGGINQNGFLNDILIIDIVYEKVTVIKNNKNYPYPREHSAIWIYNKTKLYIYGGYTEGKTLDDTSYFDLLTFKWKSIDNVNENPHQREGIGYFSLNDYIIIHGGYSIKEKKYYKDTFVFNNSKNKWKRIENNGINNLPLKQPKMLYYDNKLLMFGENGKNEYWLFMNIDEKCVNNCGKEYNRGICRKGGCFCFGSFNGIGCELELYCKANCNNHGKCRSNGKCICDNGYIGEHCEKKFQLNFTTNIISNISSPNIVPSIRNNTHFDNSTQKRRNQHDEEKSQLNENESIERQVLLVGPDNQEFTLTLGECENNCNERGICLSHICFCQEEFTGTSCDILVSTFFDENGKLLNHSSITINSLFPFVIGIFFLFSSGTFIVLLVLSRKDHQYGDFLVLSTNKDSTLEKEY